MALPPAAPLRFFRTVTSAISQALCLRLSVLLSLLLRLIVEAYHQVRILLYVSTLSEIVQSTLASTSAAKLSAKDNRQIAGDSLLEQELRDALDLEISHVCRPLEADLLNVVHEDSADLSAAGQVANGSREILSSEPAVHQPEPAAGGELLIALERLLYCRLRASLLLQIVDIGSDIVRRMEHHSSHGHDQLDSQSTPALLIAEEEEGLLLIALEHAQEHIQLECSLAMARPACHDRDRTLRHQTMFVQRLVAGGQAFAGSENVSLKLSQTVRLWSLHSSRAPELLERLSQLLLCADQIAFIGLGVEPVNGRLQKLACAPL